MSTTHADSSLVPSTIQTKAEFWTHVHEQLEHLLDGQTDWISNLANASSVIYHSLQAFELYFGPGEKGVNWAGFYLHSSFFPRPLHTQASDPTQQHRLLLGPFCGKPACQYIPVSPSKPPKGVCASAYLNKRTELVPDVETFPGHIACDGDTKSEVVIPLILKLGEGKEDVQLGVLDLDCLATGGFNEDDKEGLERIAELVVRSCAW